VVDVSSISLSSRPRMNGACPLPAVEAVLLMRSTTAPGYGSVHGSGLPFAATPTTGITVNPFTARTPDTDVDALAPPPRGTPV